MKKTVYAKGISFFLIFAMMLTMFPQLGVPFTAAMEYNGLILIDLGEDAPLSTLSDSCDAIDDLDLNIDNVISENSPELAQLVEFAAPKATAEITYGLGLGYGNNGKFLVPIEPIEDLPDFSDYIAISDRVGLEAIKDNLDGKFYLTADIDLLEADWVPIGDNSTGSDDSRFTGVFDGQGYIISNLKITDDYEYTGLFGYASDATIKNIGLEGTYINNSHNNGYIGGICGRLTGSSGATISNCYNTGEIYVYSLSSSRVGGICGTFQGNSIDNCYNTVKIDVFSVWASIGGICGWVTGQPSNIGNCYNTGVVTASYSTGSDSKHFLYSGGICGYVGNSGYLRDCFNIGTISADYFGYEGSFPAEVSVGGICAWVERGFLSNCYNDGDVSASYVYIASIGGICGYGSGLSAKSINNCYNTGEVNAYDINYANIGGICGDFYGLNDLIISNCYNAGDVSVYDSDTARIGGICGSFIGSFNTYAKYISNCYNMGDISVYNSNSARIGGICGFLGISGLVGISSDVSINNCYNMGSISANSDSPDNLYIAGICGFVGSNNNVSINNCYNMGSIAANSNSPDNFYIAGVFGHIGTNTNISNCYWMIDSQQIVNGVPLNATDKGGFHYTSSQGVSTLDIMTGRLTSEQMRNTGNFVGFDFDTIWGIAPNINNGYPYLQSIAPPAKPTYTITATAGTGGTVSGGGTFTENSSVTLTATPDNGYIFEGWYENNIKISGADALYTFTAVASRTLEARFVPTGAATYTITYNANGGSGNMASGTVTSGDDYTIAALAFTRSGYSFNSWNTAANGSGTAYSAGATIINVQSDIALYAQWAQSSGPSGGGGGGGGGGGAATADLSGSFSGDSVFSSGSGLDLVFTVAKDFGLFRDVRVDANTLRGNTHYKAESGSTVVTLFAAYLDTLPVGSHKLEVRFTDGTAATADFTVAEAKPIRIVEPENVSIPLGAGVPFADVSASAWFTSAVAWAFQNGYMTGTSTDPMLFSPNMTLTRGMVVTVLHSMEGRTGADGQSTTQAAQFSDVVAGAWYIDGVKWAAATGLASGYGDGRFGPGENITREQMATILHNYCKWKGYDVAVSEDANISSFADAPNVSGYAIPAMEWACGAGIIGGKPGGRLDPKGSATRAEFATVLMRFLEAVK